MEIRCFDGAVESSSWAWASTAQPCKGPTFQSPVAPNLAGGQQIISARDSPCSWLPDTEYVKAGGTF